MPVFLSRQLNSKQNHKVEAQLDIKRRKGDGFSVDDGWRGVVRGFDGDIMREAVVYFPALCSIKWVPHLIRRIGFIIAL
jgi:hypothetical protein